MRSSTVIPCQLAQGSDPDSFGIWPRLFFLIFVYTHGSQLDLGQKFKVFISIFNQIYWLKFKTFFHWSQRKISRKNDFRKNNFFRFSSWWSSTFYKKRTKIINFETFFKIQKPGSFYFLFYPIIFTLFLIIIKIFFFNYFIFWLLSKTVFIILCRTKNRTNWVFEFWK